MKKIKEYNDAELVALSDDDRQKVIELECYLRNIDVVEAPGPAPEVPHIDGDGHEWFALDLPEIVFNNLVNAQQVIEELRDVASKCEIYNYTCGYAHQVASPIGEIGIKTKSLYTRKALDTHEQALVAYTKAKSAHERKQCAWNKYRSEREDVERELATRLSAISDEKRICEARAAKHRRMLELGVSQAAALALCREQFGDPSWEAPTE